MKRICVMALLVLSLGAVSTAKADLFIDTLNHPHEAEVDRIAELGIAEGYGHQIFRPDIPINRAEFLKILMLAVHGEESLNIQNKSCFVDFTGVQQWFWTYACIAKQRGVIQGYPDGTFRGEQTVNLAEALKIAIKSWNIPTGAASSNPDLWYLPYFEVAEDRGLFEYFPKKADHLLTRSEMAYIVVHMNEPLKDVRNATGGNNGGILPYECGNGITEPGEQCDDGNLLNGDGCSELCIIVDEPVHHAALRVDQRPISAYSISEGSENVTLFAFDATAGRQDVALTRLTFRAENGSINTASKYRLYIDNTGDGIANVLVANGSVDSSILTFSPLSIPVQQGYTTKVEVRGDIVNPSNSSAFSLEFNYADRRFVEGVGLTDGRDVSGIELNGSICAETSICWISVNTTDSPTFDILGRGNLYVTKSSTPVPSKQILAGETTGDLLRLKFRATGEDIEVNKLRFKASSAVFKQLLIYNDSGTFPVGTAWTSDCVPKKDDTFCVSNLQWTVGKDEEKTLIVRGTVASDSENVAPGAQSTVSMMPSGNTLLVEAVGKASQENLVINDKDSNAEGEVFIGVSSPATDQAIEGGSNKVVLAKITKVKNSNPDPDQSIVPTGSAAFGVFQFIAAENNNTSGGRNKAIVQEISFSVNATNVEFLEDSFALYNPQEGAISKDCSASAYTGQITVLCTGLDSSSVNTEIESGEFIELALRGFISNSQVSAGATSVLRASLNPLGSLSTAGAVRWTDEETSLQWLDTGATSVHSTAYWNN